MKLLRALWPWLLVLAFAGCAAAAMWRIFDDARAGEPILWHAPRALALLAGAGVVAIVAFGLQRRRAATLGFSRVGLVGARGAATWLADLPAVLRVLAVAALAVALARPETYRTVEHDIDTIDIMLVVDMSTSMRSTDLPHDRLDAAQRVIRKFLHRSEHDRVGLVVFAVEAMLQCPLTLDTKVLEQIVADLQIGDIDGDGTAIGDGLALALAQLRRSDAKSKIVILLSDGDNNSRTHFFPFEAARLARTMGVKVYTLLVGREESGEVSPETLRSIASITGGEFYRADDYRSFERGFLAVRDKLDTTKRTVRERLPDRELFVPLALLAAVLVALDLLLAHTWLRRLP